MSKQGINQVTLIGLIGGKPEYTNLENKKPIAKVSLATSETWKKDNEEVSHTEWHQLVFFDGLADIANKYIVKGRKIYVQGKIKTYKWQDKEGNDRRKTEIIVSELQLLDRAKDPTPSEESINEFLDAAFEQAKEEENIEDTKAA